jgi:hypothetical protein
MPLLGTGAMLLSFDVAPEAIAEHDRWHTHEHLPERLSIPGFLRGTRWVAAGEGPRYMVVYEVASLAVLTSGPYLERLNAPSPWTQRMMPHYRGMRRGLCNVVGSFGYGQGQAGALVRFTPGGDVHGVLLRDVLPKVPELPGLGSVHLLQGAAAAPMTNEQRIRGADQGVDSALVLTGYDAAAVDAFARKLAGEVLPAHGVTDASQVAYRQDYALVATEMQRSTP